MLNGEHFYIELKTLGFSDGNNNYNKINQDGLNAQIVIEEQLNIGKGIAISMREIAPFYNNKNYDPWSPKFLITELINKIGQNLKIDQFKEDRTILLVDLTLIPLFTDAINESLAIYQEDQSFISGVLWHTVFGEIGDNIFKAACTGQKNIEGRLEKNGLLKEYNFLDIVCFRVYSLDRKSNKLVCLYKRELEQKYFDFIELSDFSNDELNSNCYQLDH